MKTLFLVAMMFFAAAHAGAKQLVSLKAASLHPKIEFEDSTIVSNLGSAIMVQTGGKEAWPNITFRAVSNPWNLKKFHTVKVDLTNAGSLPVKIGMRLDNPYENKDDAPQHAQGFELFQPAETRTMSLRLNSEAWVFDEPMELVGMRRAPGANLMDLTNIDRIQIFVGNTTEPQTFIVSNIRAEGTVKIIDGSGFLPFVDEFGQYKHAEWPQKMHSAADFKNFQALEEKSLKENPGLPNLGKFGGWTAGPRLKSTGFFRVEKVDGKWWFVDPEGYLFWSNGPTCISPGFGYTGVQDREHYFENLPSADEPLGQFYDHSTWAPHGFYADKIPFKMYQFYQASLYRKYGENWMDGFTDSAHRRLRSWGMNTIANWAVPELYLQERTPYVANFFIEGCRSLEGSQGYWSQFHDVFDLSFREAIRKHLGQRRKEASDPWCIGFFVDNELSWGNDEVSLALETLACPASQPAKQIFVDDLKAKYGAVEKLNLAWGTQYVSWKALLESQDAPDVNRAGTDLKQFYIKMANTYFSTIRDELQAAAPNHLYLGCRFAWVNDAVARSAAAHCDVVSYNQYTHSIRSLHLPGYIDRPIIIGEYHFGSTDQGHFHPGLREADTQQGRGDMFAAYLKSGLENPYVVGAHWFQYVDEHVAGRADEENYNVGLVDVCDTPYPEMVEAIRKTSKKMYEYRLGRVD